MGELIGKGSQGNVYKGLNLKNGKFVAIKQVNLSDQVFLEEGLPNVLVIIQITLSILFKFYK